MIVERARAAKGIGSEEEIGLEGALQVLLKLSNGSIHLLEIPGGVGIGIGRDSLVPPGDSKICDGMVTCRGWVAGDLVRHQDLCCGGRAAAHRGTCLP